MKTAQALVEVRLLMGLPCTREAALLARSYLLPCPAPTTPHTQPLPVGLW